MSAEKVAREVKEAIEKIIADGGFKVKDDPEVVIRPEPVFNDGNLDGGKAEVVIRF